MKKFLIMAMALLALQACKKEGCTDPNATNYDADAKKDNGSCTFASTPASNNGNNGSNSNTPESYLILNQGDTLPLTTATVNFQDSLRTLLQTNFKDDNQHLSVVYTLTQSLDTKTYTTEGDRFFFSTGGDDKMNLYLSHFTTNKNYVVESGKTIAVVASNGRKEISWSGLKLYLETDSTQSIETAAKIIVSF